MDHSPYTFSLVTIFLALLSLGIALQIFRWLRNLQKNGIKTSAVVSGFTIKNCPIFIYSTDSGETLTESYSFSHSFMKQFYKEDESYPIKYNPNKPESFWLVGDVTPWLTIIVSILLGLFFLRDFI